MRGRCISLIRLFDSYLYVLCVCLLSKNKCKGLTFQPKSHFHHIPAYARASKLKSTNQNLPDDSQQQIKKAVIVGGGVGGLAVAARLASSIREAQENWEVVLLEKNAEDMVGGRCGSFDLNVSDHGTFRHERGPSLLLLKKEYEELFESCNPQLLKDSTSVSVPVSEQFGLKIEQCLPAYQVVFDDGDRIDLGFPDGGLNIDEETKEMLKMLKKKSVEKMNLIETDGAVKWDAYMKATSAFLDCGLPNFIEERLDLLSFPAFIVEALRDGGIAWPLKPHSDVLDDLFSSEKMKALASFQDLYVGLEPYKNEKYFGGGVLKKTAPAVFGLLAALELHPTNKKAGVFAPIGGFRAVGRAFQKLAVACGARIKFNTTVTQVNEKGVHYIGSDKNTSDEGFIEADLIVVNADLPYATRSIVSSLEGTTEYSTKKPNQETYDWDDSYDFSSGVVAFHWCIDKRLDILNTHNVFLATSDRAEAEKSWRVLRDNPPIVDTSKMEISEPFNFYVHRAVKTDLTAAPEGCDSIMVLVPCPTLMRNEMYGNLSRKESIEYYKSQFSQTYVRQMRDAVIKRLEILDDLHGLKSHIIEEVIDTPGSYADFYNVGAGVPFGLSHGFNQLSLTRPGAMSKDMENVLFVGASSRPGNGVPLVLIGAKSVAKTAMKRIMKISQSAQKE